MSRFHGWIHRGLSLALGLSALSLPAGPVKVTEAEVVARGWLSEGTFRLGGRMAREVKSVETYGEFHVVQFAPEGFIVTAAEDDLEPIIAFSDKGRFEPDPAGPFYALLKSDLPQRSAYYRAALDRHQAPSGIAQIPSTHPDAPALMAVAHARAKWERLRALGNAASVTPPKPGEPGGPIAKLDDDTNGVPAAAPLRVAGFRVANGGIELTHNSARSVSILVSYDEGRSWQTLDSGVFQSTWTSSRAAREAGAWFRVEEDGLLDEMQVEFMRHPPPPSGGDPGFPGDAPGDPGSGPLAGSYLASVSDVRIPPIVQSQWSQSTAQGQKCYNCYTPNGYVCGCVATALAQVLRHWQHPTAGIGRVTRTIYINNVASSATTRGGNGTGGPYNWSLMPLAPGSSPYNASQWQMIGALCYDAGVSVNMQYSSGGSGAYQYALAGALTGVFGYANAKYVYPPNLLVPINSNLQAGYPVMLGIDANGAYGHSILCDGFGYASGTMYHHLNLGWGGPWDCWYTLPDIGGPYPWNSVHCIIFNIFPTGAGELLTGRVLTTAGVSVQGATVTASRSGQDYSGTTDTKGYYGIKVPAGGVYSVTASKIGMNSSNRTGVAVGTSTSPTYPAECGNTVNVDFALSSFALSAVAVGDSVWLRWSTPTNCGLGNNTVYVRYRTDRFPLSPSDGTEIYTGEDQVFVHGGRDASGTVTNYYAIWGNDGSPYASLVGITQASARAVAGNLKLYWTSASQGKAAIWFMQTDGAKRLSTYVGNYTPGWALVGTSDLDGDGTSDLVWQNESLGKVAYWLMDADGVRRVSGYVGTISAGWSLVGCKDLDGDGTTDLIWHQPTLGKAAYWFLNADGTRRSSGYIGDITPGWRLGGVADINGDHVPDLIWHHASLGKTAYWLLNPDGTRRSSGYICDISTGWALVGVGDINQDGVADLLWHNASMGKVAYWLLNADATRRSSGYVGDITSGWAIAGVGDLDGDGIVDLLWQNAGLGKTAFWLLDATGVRSASGYSANISPGWVLSAIADE